MLFNPNISANKAQVGATAHGNGPPAAPRKSRSAAPIDLCKIAVKAVRGGLRIIRCSRRGVLRTGLSDVHKIPAFKDKNVTKAIRAEPQARLTPAQDAKLRKMERKQGKILPNILGSHYLKGMASDLQRLVKGGAQWRGEKYRAQSKQVMSEEVSRLGRNLKQSKADSPEQQKYRKALLKSLKHLEKAQRFDASPKQARAAHHSFLKAYRKAAASDFYQTHNHDDDPPDEVKLVQLLSANLFDGVNIQQFARETVDNIAQYGDPSWKAGAEVGENGSTDSAGLAEKALRKINDLVPGEGGRSNLYSAVAGAGQKHKVGFFEDILQDLRGEVSSKRSPTLDSHAQGNLPSINHTLKRSRGEDGGKRLDLRDLLQMSETDLEKLDSKDMLAAQELVSNRMPVPTIGSHAGCEINPEFKARLDAMIVVNAKIRKANKSRSKNDQLPELRHLYVNLQDARPKDTIGSEQHRVQALRNLAADKVYQDVFKLFSMAKNTAFSHGNFESIIQEESSPPIGRGTCSKQQFWKHVENEWLASNVATSGFEWPAAISKEQKTDMLKEIKDLLDPFCKETMGQGDRQSIIELSYALLTLMAAKELGCTSFNATCKDGIDRGGGAQALLHSFILATEIYAKDSPAESAEIEKSIENLHMMMFFPALNARKREPVGERVDAHVQASNLLFDGLENMKPEERNAWIANIREACGVEGVRHRDK